MGRSTTSLLVAAAVLAAPAAADAKTPTKIPDRWKQAHGISLTKPGVAKKDPDADGLTTWAEWRSGTNPRKPDSDKDGKPDGAEDRDRDGLANAFEGAAATDPRAKDSDGDKRRDGREDPDHDHLGHAVEERFGYLPLERDSDADGVADDAENPGVIAAVKGRRVTIALAGGGKLAAKLSPEASVTCETVLAPAGAGIEGGEGGEPLAAEEQVVEEQVVEEAPVEDPLAGAAQEEGLPPEEQPPPPAEEQPPLVEEQPPFEELPVEQPPVEELPLEELPIEEPALDEEEAPDGGAEACAPAIHKGALVRAATVQPVDPGLGFVTLELLAPAKKQP